MMRWQKYVEEQGVLITKESEFVADLGLGRTALYLIL